MASCHDAQASPPLREFQSCHHHAVDMTAEWLCMYLRISHGSVSTEYGVGSIINNILFGTDGTTGYI